MNASHFVISALFLAAHTDPGIIPRGVRTMCNYRQMRAIKCVAKATCYTNFLFGCEKERQRRTGEAWQERWLNTALISFSSPTFQKTFLHPTATALCTACAECQSAGCGVAPVVFIVPRARRTAGMLLLLYVHSNSLQRLTQTIF